MRLAYQEFVHWNIQLGGKAVRLSVADERGSEYYMIVPRPSRNWPAIRNNLLGWIGQAIEEGCQPGQVTGYIDDGKDRPDAQQ